MATQEPRAVIEEFFDRMADQSRRDTIGELFAQEAVITLPGVQFAGPEAPAEFLSFLDPRYEQANKTFDRWYACGDGTVVSVGTLYGVTNNGEQFEDVRYLDIYEVSNDRITRMDVYNDLAAEGVVTE